MRAAHHLLTATVCLFLTSAGSTRAQRPVGAPPSRALPATAVAPQGTVPANYLIKPNDLLEVKVFQEDDMDWTVRVKEDGMLVLPLVGSIATTRNTPEAIAATVRDRLHDGWLVHPQVSVAVLEFSKRRFTILGQVEKAGQIDFPDNASVDVLQAIGMAGGYAKNADPGRVYIKRQVGSKQAVIKVDARRMARDAAARPFEVLPGDTITVAETLF